VLRRPAPLRIRRSAAAPAADPQPNEGSAEAPEDTTALEAGARARTAGKGRPTPKRSESEKRRRQPYAAPKGRKEARQSRTVSREDRARRLDAMRRGEEWALSARDRGKAKALARDYVDSRRRLGEFYMPSLLVLLVLVFIKAPFVQNILVFLVLGGGLALFTEAYLVGRKARALAQQRFPGESTQGVRMYAGMRTLQMRRMRTPKPRISPGGEF
jgi:hypothetical protein